ncbi:MAG: M23 family metallopeptidase [Spirochaetales bacterium]|jgi:hypothetical protein|nr:M23 family metallopeptidase [Spirochaetales bacterium]
MKTKLFIPGQPPLWILLLALLGAPLLSAEPRILPDPEVRQGEVLSVLVWDRRNYPGVSAQLLVEGRSPQRVQGFPVIAGEEGWYGWLILFGIDSLLRTGPARVVCSLEGFSGAPEAPVNILPGNFFSEDIPLNEAMSSLSQTEDPERTRQSQVMTRLFYTFNRDNVFLFEPLSQPMTGRRRTSYFGDRRRFLYAGGGVSQSIHYGVDFSAEPGAPIGSDGPGRVVFSDYRIITGHTVVVEHLPGVYSLYYHMTDRNLNVGNMVETGTRIGTVGATGLVTGAHLHWEVRVNGVAVSPDFLTQKTLVDKDRFLSIVRTR